MQDLKFRVWDNKYQYFNYKVLIGNTVAQDHNYTAHAMWIDPAKVDYPCEPHWCNFDEGFDGAIEQYIGRPDRHGQDIYEGDRVKIYDHLLNRIFTGVVEFADCSFCISDDGYRQYRMMDYQIEVIGNIHEDLKPE
jgi:hypothetical protein